MQPGTPPPSEEAEAPGGGGGTAVTELPWVDGGEERGDPKSPEPGEERGPSPRQCCRTRRVHTHTHTHRSWREEPSDPRGEVGVGAGKSRWGGC